MDGAADGRSGDDSDAGRAPDGSEIGRDACGSGGAGKVSLWELVREAVEFGHPIVRRGCYAPPSLLAPRLRLYAI